jgi:hypothetical protein
MDRTNEQHDQIVLFFATVVAPTITASSCTLLLMHRIAA